MKKVVLVNQSTGYLMIDIVNAFAEKYDEVVLLTGSIKTMERNLNVNVKVVDIAKYNRSNIFFRFTSWVIATIQILFIITSRYTKYEVVFFTNPPFSYFISFFLRQKVTIVVYDLYPDLLRNIGINNSNFFFRTWAKLNLKVFHRVQKIITLSESMSVQLSKYVSTEKITVIPNWYGSDKFKAVVKQDNKFIRLNHLADKFIVMYSGNIGFTHNVEVIIQVAKILHNEKDICFLFIGEGKKKKSLIKFVNDYGLDNCLFLTWQPREVLPLSLSAADLGIVTLNDEVGMSSVPSKTYNLMASAVPLLGVSPDNSEIARLIKRYNLGRNFMNDDVDNIAEFIVYCKSNKNFLTELSRNSKFASRDFSSLNSELYVKCHNE